MDAKHAFNLTQRGGKEGQVQLKKVREREGETVREREGEREGAQTGHRMSACLDNNDL